jgi:integrase
MASIKRHRGKLVVDWRDSEGERHRERVKNREAGEKRLAEILKSGKRPTLDMTFKEYGDWWLGTVKGNIADSTYQEYEAVLRNHVYPSLKDKRFTKITRPMIRDLIAEKRKKYEPATVRNMLAPVRAMYNQAIEDGEAIAMNPAARFGKKNKGRQKTIINPYTREEASAFLQEALQRVPKDYPLYLFAPSARECDRVSSWR